MILQADLSFEGVEDKPVTKLWLFQFVHTPVWSKLAHTTSLTYFSSTILANMPSVA